MNAEINRCPKFLHAPHSPDPANFGPKRCFLVCYSPNPSCVPNLKLLPSMVTEINRGSQNFWDAPLAQPPASFGSEVVFGKQLPVLKWYKNSA